LIEIYLVVDCEGAGKESPGRQRRGEGTEKEKSERRGKCNKEKAEKISAICIKIS